MMTANFKAQITKYDGIIFALVEVPEDSSALYSVPDDNILIIDFPCELLEFGHDYVFRRFRYLNQEFIDIGEKPDNYYVFDPVDMSWKIDEAQRKVALSNLAKVTRSEALKSFYYLPKQRSFQCDPLSLTLISGKALKITRKQLNNEPVENQVWRTTDNLFVSFTPNEFLEFAEAADEYVEQVYSQSWQQIDGDN